MKQIITAKLKLLPTTEQFQALRQTQLAYRDALNAVSQYAFEQGKTSSNITLHRGRYAELRARYHLPSQLACSVERQVAATYKGLWTKLKKNSEHRRKKITKKRFKGLDKPPKYSSPTVQYTYERDYTFQRNQQVSIGTLHGRATIPYQGYDEHVALIRHGATIGDAKLWYDKARKTFYVLVSLEIDVPEPTCEQLTEVAGVDVGIRVRREVAWIIARYGKNHSRAWCFTTSTLPGHAARVIQRCEAPGTMNPQSKDWCLNREGRASLLASKRKGARVSGTVNICECSLTVVTTNKPKMLTGLSQKALWLA